jgi:hypothetical protein
VSTTRGADRRPRPAIGIRVLAIPPVPATAVHECLSRLPARQVVDRVGGLMLWLPRLGITVLPHEPVTGGIGRPYVSRPCLRAYVLATFRYMH